ncbi:MULTISPECIES: SMI1/KNR4 family protein [unclassified Aureispira]|uniref:SMI1/KNR4 family protein n=1 Tax=unclassified Aureispira TaxID=2649989 RepID=UPI00069713BC|nr:MULTISPECIES: SMI1/KNR4 family protein [unclassified Aureispira]WMX16960.1 SMI1/KNR4 family protein [Aureispira sp. CCB-E]
MKTVREYLQLIKDFYWEHAPYYKNLTFNPMTSIEIQDLEKKVGFSLHNELVEFLTYCDYRIDFEGGYVYENPATVLNNWSCSAELIDEGIFKDTVAFKEQHGFTNWKDKRLARKYCSKGWIPFCVDSGGNQLLVDHDPGPVGQVGQIVGMEFQDGQGPGYTTSSLSAYLADTYECLINYQWSTWDYGSEGNQLIEIDSYITPSNHKSDT